MTNVISLADRRRKFRVGDWVYVPTSWDGPVQVIGYEDIAGDSQYWQWGEDASSTSMDDPSPNWNTSA